MSFMSLSWLIRRLAKSLGDISATAIRHLGVELKGLRVRYEEAHAGFPKIGERVAGRNGAFTKRIKGVGMLEMASVCIRRFSRVQALLHISPSDRLDGG